MIINDTQDGYVIFLNQKEINRILDWYDVYVDNTNKKDDELDLHMRMTLRPKDRRRPSAEKI